LFLFACPELSKMMNDGLRGLPARASGLASVRLPDARAEESSVDFQV
jgi:hypothetical protein